MQTRHADLVFLPGWGFTASVFDAIAPYFPDKQLHFIDLPPMNSPLSTANLSSFANTLPQQATLVGWSLGGLLAIELCASFPSQFEQLILLASSPKFSADEQWHGISSKRANSFLTHAEQDMRQTIGEFQKLTCFPSRSARDYFNAHTRNDEFLLQQLNYLFQSDLRTPYSNLTQPILTIAGERDAILPPTPDTNHIITGAGHAFFYTHAAEVSQQIHAFLDY